MEAGERAELAPHYYRDNFLVLCDTVEAQYGDLLAPSERDFLDCYRELPFDAQCLFVRLVSRVGPWFRESRLAYPELGAITPIVDCLLATGMAESADELSVQELGSLFTRAELTKAFGALLGSPVAGGKPGLLEAIDALALDQAELLSSLAALDSQRIIAPCAVQEVQLFQLLFFGNRRQSLTDFVLSDLGVANYYPYSLDRGHRLFPHREAVDEYLALSALSDCWYELREAGETSLLVELARELVTIEVRFPSSEGRWYRLCNNLARDLERQQELALAGQLYSFSGRHPARERRLRILERSEDWHDAVQLCEQILAQPWCEEERDASARILPRVQRKLGQKPAGRRRDDFTRLALEVCPGSARVELLVARQLQPRWAAVYYVENTLMNALFGLVFWEQIFTPVPGAFHNPFQSVPSDMYSPEFRARRQRALAARLDELRAGDIATALLDAYQRYGTFQCRWVDWRRLDEALVAQATTVIPGDHLLAIWERMLFDPGENRRGFPDLLALGNDPGDYQFIEVKGPGDALQESQKRWLRFFDRQGIPAAVARVTWQESGAAGAGRDADD